jgi:hypothetical protein
MIGHNTRGVLFVLFLFLFQEVTGDSSEREL